VRRAEGGPSMLLASNHILPLITIHSRIKITLQFVQAQNDMRRGSIAVPVGMLRPFVDQFGADFSGIRSIKVLEEADPNDASQIDRWTPTRHH